MKRSLLFIFALFTCIGLSAQVSITFNVDMNQYTVDPGGVYVAGGTGFGVAGDNQLLDTDGDGVYSITIMEAIGFESNYTFLNGNCPDWSCKENIAGQSCADADNFNDRFLPALTGDVVINTCFEECTTDFACTATPTDAMVTFQVNMADETTDPAGVFLAGNFNGWNGTANPMEDPDGDDVWTLTAPMPQGVLEFKFVNGTAFEGMDAVEDAACTMDFGGFVNRVLDITSDAAIVLDPFCFQACTDCGGAATDGMVTFSVDMNEYTATTFTTVYVSGGFNGWSGDSNPLADVDGDGVWEGTFLIPSGAQEFKFSADNWAIEEMFVGGESCTITDGDFTNRIITVNGDATLPTVCWESCDACGVVVGMASITFNVNMNQYTVSADGLFLAGGSAFGGPSDNPMEDPDGDGIYSITFMRPIGTVSNYTFVNGDGWGFKEDIAGLPCSDPDSFDDRLPVTINQDTVINTCFAECTDDTNCTPINMTPITFNVNMNEFTVSAEGVFLAGGSAFNGPNDNPMEDPDGDGIYSITLMRPIGTVSNYTFVNGDWWDDKEDIAGLPCSDPDNFNDRLPITVAEGLVINTCFQECTDDLNCTPVAAPSMVTFQVNMQDETTSADGVFMNANFDGWSGGLALEDTDGDDIWSLTMEVPVGLGEYLFINGMDATVGQEMMDSAEDADCTLTSGTFVNRTVDVTGDNDIVLDPVCFESCTNCVGISTNDLLSENTLFRLAPSLINGTPVILYFDEPSTERRTLSITNAMGQVVHQATIGATATQHAIATSDIPNGLYYVIVETDRTAAIEKFIVSK